MINMVNLYIDSPERAKFKTADLKTCIAYAREALRKIVSLKYLASTDNILLIQGSTLLSLVFTVRTLKYCNLLSLYLTKHT